MKYIQQTFLTALFFDLILHLIVFKSMAIHITKYGLSWWNRWLFEGHGYPAMALDPALHFFGEGITNLYVKPFLVIFILVLFSSPIIGFFKLMCYKIVKPIIFIILNTLGAWIESLYLIIQEKMGWFFSKKQSTVHGTGKLAGWWERRKFLRSKFKGFSIGSKLKISEKASFENMIVVGPPGSGKSTITAFPSLLQSTGASWVVTDPSQELYETSGYLASIGYEILRFTTYDLSQSCRFNPLLRCQDTNEVSALAESLIKMAYPSEKGNDAYWTSSAKRLLKCFLLAVRNLPKEQAHLPNAYRLLSEFEFSREPIEAFIMNNVDENTRKEFKGISAANEKEFSSFLSTAQTALEKFGGDEKIAWLVSGDTLNFDMFRKKPTALFLQFPEISLPYYAPLINVLTTSLMEFCMKEKKAGQRSIFFLLEEIGILRINKLEIYLSQLRKYNAGALLLLQNFQQLSVLLSREKAKSVLGSISHKVFFGGISHETCQQVESMLGKTTVTENGKSIGTKVLFADQIRMLPENNVLYIASRHHPAKLKVERYYKNRKLSKRAAIGPFPITAIKVTPVDYMEIPTAEPQ